MATATVKIMVSFKIALQVYFLFIIFVSSFYFYLSNPCTHFPRRNRHRKITELMHHVSGYAQNTTRISGIK